MIWNLSKNSISKYLSFCIIAREPLLVNAKTILKIAYRTLIFALHVTLLHSSYGQLSIASKSDVPSVDTVNYEDFSFRGIPIMTTEKEVYGQIGKPTTVSVFSAENISEVRSFNTEGKLLRMNEIPEGGIPAASLRYDHFAFTLTEGMAYMSNVFFKDPSIRITTPEIVLSNETTLEEIKQIFPNSYQEHGLRGPCNSVKNAEDCELIEVHDYTYQGKEYSVPIWTVNLAFVDGKLAVMTASKRLRYDE